MDPYLEDLSLWRGFHHAFAEEIKRTLNARLAKKYFRPPAPGGRRRRTHALTGRR